MQRLRELASSMVFNCASDTSRGAASVRLGTRCTGARKGCAMGGFEDGDGACAWAIAATASATSAP